MKARARDRVFEDRSWNGIVSRIVSAYGLSTTAGDRTAAARDLENGWPVYIAGVLVKPL